MHDSRSFGNREFFIMGILIVMAAIRISSADTTATPVNPGHPLSQTWIDTNLSMSSHNIYTTTGNVGIGVQTPQAPLHIISTSSITDLLIETGTSGNSMAEAAVKPMTALGQGRFTFLDSAGTSAGYVTMAPNLAGSPLSIYSFNSRPITFGIDSERMRIDALGNVGIGINPPTQRLDVSGKIRISNDATAPSAGTIRYLAGNFEGYNGSSWNAFTGGSGAGSQNLLQVLQAGSDASTYAGITRISGVTINNLTSGRAIEAISPTGDGVMGKTSAAGRSGVYGWSTNAGSYAGYFEGGLGFKVVGNADWTGYTLTGGSVPWARLTGFPAACPAGQFATQVGGTLTCAAAVTSVGTGAGLSGGPITSSGTINLANPSKSCGAGFAIQSFDISNALAPTCISAGAGGGGTVTSVGYGAGLTSTTAPNPITASGTLSLSINSGAVQTCAGTQKVSSLSPAGIITCSNDVDTNSGGDITDVFAGTGISGGGSAGAVTLSLNTLGISTCTNSATNKIYWDSTNSRLTCGTDQTGAGGGVSSVTGSSGVTASPTTGAVGVSLTNPSKVCGAGTAVQSFDLSNANAPACVSVGVTGSGTQNYVSKWGVGGTSIGNSMIYDSGANIGIGTANPTSILPYTKFLVASNDPLSSDIGVVLATTGGQPALQLARARGSVGAPSIVQNGDPLGEIVFGGYDGSDYMVSPGAYAARIISEVDGAPGLNNIPARFSFQTTVAGTYFDRMRITSSGNVGISSVNPGSRLTVSGGDVYVATSGNGIILKDTTDGTCRRLVLTSGALSLSGTMACPSS